LVDAGFLLLAALVEAAFVDAAFVALALVGLTLFAASASFLVLLAALAFVTLTVSPEELATARISAAGFLAVAAAFVVVLVVADFFVAAAGLIAFG
jgi:hypothetical protein